MLGPSEATYWGKVTKQIDANPWNPWQEDMSQKAIGSNPATGKLLFFLMKSLLKFVIIWLYNL